MGLRKSLFLVVNKIDGYTSNGGNNKLRHATFQKPIKYDLSLLGTRTSAILPKSSPVSALN